MQARGSHLGQHFKGKYFDTAFNFCLTYKRNLIASVGFDAEDKAVYIKQIQGIKGENDKLKPLKWERALVTYAVQWAEQQGIPQVRVISVDNNKWAQRHNHLNHAQGKMLYDVTATRVRYKGMKFEREESGNYIMKLQTHEQRAHLAA